MDFAPLGRLFLGHPRLVMAVMVLVAAGAYGSSYLFTPQYTSKTTVLVAPKATRILGSNGAASATQPSSVDVNSAKSIEQTHAALVSSRLVAEGVVSQLKLESRPEDQSFVATAKRQVKHAFTVVRDTFLHGTYVQPSRHEAAVSQVQNGLLGTPIKDSYLIEVKATADTAQGAADMAAAAADQLIKISTERARADALARSTFLKSELERSRAEVEATQKAVINYKQSNGITTSASGLLVSAATQEQLSAQYQQVKVDLAAAKAQEKSLEDQITQVSSTDAATSTVANGRSSTTVTNTQPNRIYQDLVTQRGTLDAAIAALSAKRDTLDNLLTPSSGLAPDQEAKLRNLELQQSSASDSYTALSARYQDALTNAQDQAIDLSRADRPGIPLYPDKPLRYLFALIGLVAGIGAGLGIAWLAEQRANRRRMWAGSLAPT